MEPSKLHLCARWFAHQGHLVFPLKPGEKTPATRHGLKDASNNPTDVDTWWTKNPTYNIGLPTGHRFDVLDLDLALEVGEGVHTDLGEPLAVVRTPRGGAHLYLPPCLITAGNRAGILPGIDWRGPGGYVVAPPSTSPVGDWTYLDYKGLFA